MQILRELFNDIITSTLKTRAVAMSVFIKKRFKSSAIHNFSYNKLHEITGLHAETCKKYVKALKNLGLVEFVGNNKDILLFKTLHSRHERKNIKIDEIVGHTVKTIFYSLLAIFNVEIVRHKDFAKQVIAESTNGFNGIKKASRKAWYYGYKGKEFMDNGISFKTIANKLNCGIQKAQNIIKFAVEYCFLNKHHHAEQTNDIDAIRRFYNNPEDYTFATRHNLYIIKANSYTLGCRYTTDS